MAYPQGRFIGYVALFASSVFTGSERHRGPWGPQEARFLRQQGKCREKDDKFERI